MLAGGQIAGVSGPLLPCCFDLNVAMNLGWWPFFKDWVIKSSLALTSWLRLVCPLPACSSLSFLGSVPTLPWIDVSMWSTLMVISIHGHTVAEKTGLDECYCYCAMQEFMSMMHVDFWFKHDINMLIFHLCMAAWVCSLPSLFEAILSLPCPESFNTVIFV